MKYLLFQKSPRILSGRWAIFVTVNGICVRMESLTGIETVTEVGPGLVNGQLQIAEFLWHLWPAWRSKRVGFAAAGQFRKQQESSRPTLQSSKDFTPADKNQSKISVILNWMMQADIW